MGKIYKNQSSLRLTLQTGIDISGASTFQIKYLKPGSTTAQTLTAALDGTQDIYYDFTNDAGESELDTSGVWIFWAYITFSDDRIAPGEPVEIIVFDESK